MGKGDGKGSCGGGETSLGCCQRAPGNEGVAVLVLSIIGIIGAAICLVMDLTLFFLATIFLLVGLSGAGFAIYLGILVNIFYFIAFSIPICCCVHAGGYKCAAITHVIGFFLGVILVIATISSHADVDDKCENWYDDNSDANDCKDSLHGAFPIIYAVLIAPSFWSIITVPFLWKGKDKFHVSRTEMVSQAQVVPTAEMELSSKA